MGVSLSKGNSVSLAKAATDTAVAAGVPAEQAKAKGADLTKVTVCLGWDARTTTGKDFDLDASAVATGANKKVPSDDYFVFFNNLKSPEGAINHQGDNLTGDGDGDDEKIDVDLSTVSADISHIFFPVTIHQGADRGQSFGQVRNAYIRVVDKDGTELIRYDLSEDASTETALVFGELYRDGQEWQFRAAGSGEPPVSDLASIARNYGVNL